MKKLSLLALTAIVLITAGCRKKQEKVVIVEKDDYSDNYYDDYGRPVHGHSTTVKTGNDGKVVKYVQKPSSGHKQARTHVEID